MSNSTRILIALAGIIISSLFWVWNGQRKEAYNNTTAGLAEIELEKMKMQRKLFEAETSRLAASGTPTSSIVQSAPSTTVQPVPQVSEKYADRNMREMIAHCGKNTQELTYKPDVGCFFFDNLSGSSEKAIGLWSRNKVHSMIGAFDDKPNIVLTGPDGSICESSAADHCEHWVRQFSADSDGFRKLKVRVPPGQGLIANFRTS